MAEIETIFANSGRDAHNVVMTKEALDSAAAGANGDRAVRMGANHDPFCMPCGKIVEAWVEPRGDRHVLVARFYIEDSVRHLVHRATGEQLALLDFTDYPKPFSKRVEKVPRDKTEVHVDFVNFDSKQEYDRFLNEVDQIDDGLSCGRGFGRKSLIPEPFIQFVLSNPEAATVLAVVGPWILARAGKFITHTTDETLRKVGDDLSDRLSAKIISVYESYKRHQAQDERPVVIQIVMPGDVELNLLSRTEHDAKFQNIALKQLRAGIEKYRDLIQEADSVTFGREGDGNWEFLYLTTKTGKVIGTFECFDRTVKLLNEISQSRDPEEGEDCIEE